MVTFFTEHLSKSETVLGYEIFKAFHIYVELNTHERALGKSSLFSSYAGLSYDCSLVTALVWCFDTK